MKFYLSSMGIGNKGKELFNLINNNSDNGNNENDKINNKIAYIPNACDFSNVNLERRKITESYDIKELEKLNLKVEYLDLKKHFNKTDELRKKLKEFKGVFVRGGNTFILRQAMKLSGFDIIFNELLKTNFVYAGYSAGICVLSKDLKTLQIVDDPYDMPYENKEIIWEGLGYLDYMIFPHYKSEHPESKDIDKEIEKCIKNNIPFKTLSDGDVIII